MPGLGAGNSRPQRSLLSLTLLGCGDGGDGPSASKTLVRRSAKLSWWQPIWDEKLAATSDVPPHR